MSEAERRLLLTTAALALGRGPMSTTLNSMDQEILSNLIGGADWRSIADGMMALIKKVAAEGGG